MRKFEKILLRLKEKVGIPHDKEIAEMLGLSVKAFAARKARDTFPTDKLFALKARRPELGLDVHYILEGRSAEEDARVSAESVEVFLKSERYARQLLESAEEKIREVGSSYHAEALNEREVHLINSFRAATEAGKKAIQATADAVEKERN